MTPVLLEKTKTTTMVHIDRLETDREPAQYRLCYEDGTAYEIDEYTANWLTSMMQSLLKIRM